MSPQRSPNQSAPEHAPARHGIEVLDFRGIAEAMWMWACSGVSTNAIGEFDTAYLVRCSRRVGSTTLLFARDDIEPAICRFQSPALQRSWALTIACHDHVERDAWLRAFFGEHQDRLWATRTATGWGRVLSVSHWRLFCDESWVPAVLHGEQVELRAAGYRAAREVALYLLPSA